MTVTSVRKLLGSMLTVGVLGSLMSTGLVGVVARPAPILEAKVRSLTSAVARAGFERQLDTGLPTEMVGFEWDGASPGAVEVRSRGATPGPWIRLESSATEGPDKGSREDRGRTTAGPVWVGKGVRNVEVRVVDGNLDRLKLHAIRSEPPASSGGIEEAGAGPPQPSTIPRSQWGADESLRNTNPGCGQPEYADTVRFAVVHHTDGSNNYGPGDSASIIRGIYYFHTQVNGWCDIGYNFLVDKFGQAFEGRYGGPTRAVIGAHALGWNTQSTGVALIGSFQTAAVPDPAFASLRSLLSWKLAVHGVNPEGQIAQNGRTIPTIIGHRDVNATDCPGDFTHAMLPQLRTAVAAGYSAVKVYAVHSGKSLDVNNGSQANGAPVIQWTPHTGFNQQWSFQPVADGIYRIINVNSGKALDVERGSTADGARIIQWSPHGGANQQWRLKLAPSGTAYQIISVMTGKAVDVNGGSTADGTQVIQWTPHLGANQQWQLATAV
ncbi:MAG: RICIN domain-containing protein [Actinomycetota bacterium]|nr:RICIN domain-containing protein [Actinomycetota bacterium]